MQMLTAAGSQSAEASSVRVLLQQGLGCELQSLDGT